MEKYSLLLPVTPEMADKIFSDHKRCIYSNKLAKKKADKILIYVSDPVNKVCGEALVNNPPPIEVGACKSLVD